MSSCLQHFSHADVLQLRSRITVPGGEENVYRAILPLLINQTGYQLLGRKVCSLAFVCVLGISKYKLMKVKLLEKTGSFELPKIPRNASADKSDFVFRYLDDFFRSVCQTMADATDSKGRPYWQLPSYLRSGELLTLLQNTWIAQHPQIKPPSYSLLMKVWKLDFSHVRQPRNSDYGACSDCFDLVERFKACRSPDDKVRIEQDKLAHHELHEESRKDLTRRMQQVRRDPNSAIMLGTSVSARPLRPSSRRQM